MDLNVPQSVCTGGAGAAAAPADSAAPKEPVTFDEKLAVCKTVHADNVKRFAALRAAPPMKTRKTYVLPIVKDGALELKVMEDVTETPMVDVLAAWKGPIELTAIEDIFNDKLVYSVTSWTKLEAHNDTMLRVFAKFEILQQDRPNVIAASSAFVAHFRAIGLVLTAMEVLARGDTSIEEEAGAKLAALAADVTAAAGKLSIMIRPSTHLSDAFTLANLGGKAQHMAFLQHNLRASGVATPAFQLLYQATLDGKTPADVLRKCKGMGPALVIGREAVHGWLLGGYMDCGIDDEAATADGGAVTGLPAPQSFVFTLTNPHGLPPTAWRRGMTATGVCRGNKDQVLLWAGTLSSSSAASVLAWTTGDAADYYQSRGEHDRKVYTGKESWTCDEVLIFRV